MGGTGNRGFGLIRKTEITDGLADRQRAISSNYKTSHGFKADSEFWVRYALLYGGKNLRYSFVDTARQPQSRGS